MSHDKEFKDQDILANSFRATQVRAENFACYPPRSYNHVSVYIRGDKNPKKKNHKKKIILQLTVLLQHLQECCSVVLALKGSCS